ncbi:hypothetical protein [Streptomyces cathayae]|uniref:Phage holin family protein n=1 Tax=Streptomyces cathayae TaxID=3031124 RepID=A0ABY8KED7_9ACTN|nr:hypothetical protein [Streptomyces sp. HUAS 5]WGD45156.1 hypothetical protein PYS65_34245 [Streptomyces sp. HUAS 5]
MARRKHVDLSNEEPGLRAEPVITGLETMDLEVSPKRLRLLTAMRHDSRLGAGAVSLLLLAAILGCSAGIGALAHWVGVGPVGCMIAAGVAAVVAIGMIIFVFTSKGTDRAPETGPPVSEPAGAPGAGKKGKNGKRR